MRDNKSLFNGEDDETSWQKEWKDMPEFIQEKQAPYQKIIIRFASKDDVDSFSKLIGQPITAKTKSIWHPQLKRGLHGGKRYINEP